MAADKDPLSPDQDPSEDNPDLEAPDKAGDAADSDPTDWKAKHDALAASSAETIRRQGGQLGQLKRQLEAAQGSAPADSTQASGEAIDTQALDRLAGQSWELVKALHGAEAVDAYDSWYHEDDPMLAAEAYATERYGDSGTEAGAGETLTAFRQLEAQIALADTPFDIVDALEAYAKVRYGQVSETPEANSGGQPGPRTRADALQPRVDTNRSDSPDSDQAPEAGKSGGLEGWLQGSFKKAGWIR